MRPDTQRELVADVLAMQSRRTTTLADEVLRVPASNYTSEDHARSERERWFGDQPSVACLGADLPSVGSYVTLHVGGVPIVIVRGRDGVVHAFENICRHRAAPIARGCGQIGPNFACGFHGWTYSATDGRLIGQPKSCDGFASVDPTTLGLRPLAAVERHGLVVVDPRRQAWGHPIDVEGWLWGLADELAEFGYERCVPFRSQTDTWHCNWKLLLDTFFESYHVFALHRESLGSRYPTIASPARAFGPHNRIIVPQSSILDLAGEP